MAPARPTGQLGARLARVLRIGTLLAVVVIAAGLAASLLFGPEGPGPTPVVELLGAGAADALIGAGLLGLTLIPVVALAVAAATLAAEGERPAAGAATVVLLLLVASLVVAAIVGAG